MNNVLDGVKTGILEKNDTTFGDLEDGSILIPMSNFKQLGTTNVFVVEDSDYKELKDFLLVDDKREPPYLYCKRSTGKKIIEESSEK